MMIARVYQSPYNTYGHLGLVLSISFGQYEHLVLLYDSGCPVLPGLGSEPPMVWKAFPPEWADHLSTTKLVPARVAILADWRAAGSPNEWLVEVHYPEGSPAEISAANDPYEVRVAELGRYNPWRQHQ